jgi:hypothetical protein
MRLILSVTVLTALSAGFPFPSYAQWLHYPTPGIPRTKDGKPDLGAPTREKRLPRTSGMIGSGSRKRHRK